VPSIAVDVLCAIFVFALEQSADEKLGEAKEPGLFRSASCAPCRTACDNLISVCAGRSNNAF